MIYFTKNKLYEIATPRTMLTDELWSKIKAIFLEDRVYNKSVHRQTMQGILYRLRVGCPWRDLPACAMIWLPM